ncbi:MAG: ABC transporter ATP-binding protein [Spirulinaceae cyanobacterium]
MTESPTETLRLNKTYNPDAFTTLSKIKTKTEIAVAAKKLDMVFYSGIEHFQALRRVNFEVEKGDLQLLMGPSGSGKTTLLSILAGLLTPTSGQVHLLNSEITKMSQKELARFRRDNIGFIFQGFNLFPALSAAENVELAYEMKGLGKKEAKEQSQILLTQVGLADKANLRPKDLSGGQKQRVAIARALVGNPPLIMADEPTASLDSHSGHTVVELLRSLAKEGGSTVIIVTHDSRIMDVADSILYLEDGRLRQPGELSL